MYSFVGLTVYIVIDTLSHYVILVLLEVAKVVTTVYMFVITFVDINNSNIS